MADFDVSMRLGIDYRDRDAKNAERDLQDIRRAAERLGVGEGTERLNRELNQTGKAANAAERQVKELDRAADRLGARSATQRLERDIKDVGQASYRSERQVAELRREAERFGRVRGVDRVGREVDHAGRQFGGLNRTLALTKTNAGQAFNALVAFAAPAAILAGLEQIERKFAAIDEAAAGVAMTAEMYDPKVRKAIVERNKQYGLQYGASQQQVGEARQVFAAGGLDKPEDQNKVLGPTLRAAIGSGSDASTMARAGRAYLSVMQGKPEDLPAFYDQMSKAGKLGTFEIEAMARNLPSLGSQYAASGGVGLKGSSELFALAEVAAKGAGSEDEAATNLENYLSKLFSPETVTNIKKQHVDLPKLVESSRAEGKHPALAILDEVQRLTGGDPYKMGKLFGDQQVSAALRPLMQNRQTLEDYRQQIYGQSEGTAQKDFDYQAKTPAGQERQQEAKREVSQLTIGESLVPGSQAASSAYTRAMGHFAGIASIAQNEGALEAFKAAVGIRPAEDTTVKAKPSDLETEMGELRKELSAREAQLQAMNAGRPTGPGFEGPNVAAENLTYEIEQLRSAVRSLEERLKALGKTDGEASPIGFRAFQSEGTPRLINASYGGGSGSGGGAGGGAYRGTYAGGPLMDGTGGSNLGTGGGERTASLGRNASAHFEPRSASASGAYNAPRAWPDLEPSAFLNGDPASFPAGMRNNNPGNLKYSGSAWQRANLPGLVGPSRNTDEGSPQAVFNSPQAGLEAMARLAVGKFDGGRKSVNDMISASGGWTPGKGFASDNVAKTMGVDANAKIDLRNPATMQSFMKALIRQEDGPKGAAYTDDMIADAVGHTLAPGTQGIADAARRLGVGDPRSIDPNAVIGSDHPIWGMLDPDLAAAKGSILGHSGGGRATDNISAGALQAADAVFRHARAQGIKMKVAEGGGSNRHSANHGGSGLGEAIDIKPTGGWKSKDQAYEFGEVAAAAGANRLGVPEDWHGLHVQRSVPADKGGSGRPTMSWSYGAGGGGAAGQGGSFRSQLQSGRLVTAEDRAHVDSLYAQPDAKAVAEGSEPFTGPRGEFGEDGWTKDEARRPKRADLTPRAGAGAGPGRSPSGPVSPTINQHFHGVDPQIMAQRAAQAQRRSIRSAEARAMHDTGVPVA